MTEDEFVTAVIKAARLCGWLVHHDRPALDRKGRWRTPVQGHVGFPDLVLARDGDVLIWECKSDTGRMEPGQREWLRATGGKVIRPRDLKAVLARLSRPRTTPAT